MLIRQGFFDGKIRAGMESAFYAYVHETMMPIWQSFPGLLDLRVSKAISEDGVDYPLHTSFAFKDDAALKQVLESPQRQRSLAATKELMKMFDGRIFHVITRPL